MSYEADKHFAQGQQYSHQRQWDDAIAEYTIAIELDPNHAPAYYWRGNVYDFNGENDKSIADYTRSLEIKPDTRCYTLRGAAYYKKGDYNRAIADWTKAIELTPNDAQLYKLRSDTYKKIGNERQSLENLAVAVALGWDFNDEWKNKRIIGET
jgi:tetratricopeptide (TPR) repeat protein